MITIETNEDLMNGIKETKGELKELKKAIELSREELKETISVAASAIELVKEANRDRGHERNTSNFKYMLTFIVTLVIIMAFSCLWAYEIHESYSDVTIENSSTATIERKEVSE